MNADAVLSVAEGLTLINTIKIFVFLRDLSGKKHIFSIDSCFSGLF